MNKIWIIIPMILLLTPMTLAFSGNSTNYKLYYGIDGMGLAQGSSADYKLRSNLLYQPIGKFQSTGYKLYLGPYYIKLTSAIVPNITILSPQNTSYATNTTWANVTLDKQGSWCGRSLDGGLNVTMTNSSGNWNNMMIALSNGAHTVKFYCNDTNGVMGYNTTQFFYCYGDVSGSTPGIPDGKVDMKDIAFLVANFNYNCGNPSYNPKYDLNDDCHINMKDIAIDIAYFNTKCV